MIRRPRLSFKPNVRPSGRSVGSGARDGSSASQPEEPVQPGDTTMTAGPEQNDNSIGDGSTPCVAESEEPPRAPDIPEKSSGASRENEPSKPATAPLQRRKRISTLPNLAKPRVSSSAPVTPSQKPQQVESPPTLPISSVPSMDDMSSPEKAKVPSSAKSQGSNSAPQGQRVTLPEKRTPIPQVPQFSPLKKSSLKQSEMNPVKSVDFIQKEEFSPLKERPSQKSSSNEYKKITPKKLVASGNLEKERLQRAQKLRELLKDELRKERKEWKAKHPAIINTGDQERSKMLMRDFIYFIPSSNPMTASFVDTRSSEKAPPESQLSLTPVKNINNDEDDDLDEEEDESQLLAPRVKVAEDGSIILDEESLTVEVSRSKAPIVEGNDPIFERGSTTTYSSFRKSNYSKPWSVEETDMFFLAISMVGTDFSMIGQLFPHRERIEIKNKFKREERTNSWRIDKAFREKTSFDFEFFSKRLERALEAAKRKRASPKFKQPREKKATKPRKKQKDKTATEQVLSDGEMAVLSDGEGADARTEEKENEGSVSVEECLLPSDNVPAKKRRSRKKSNDTKVLEEETLPSLPEDTTALPKKHRKRGAADQVIDSKLAVDDENHEDVQAAPDTVEKKHEKKKKSRKKKPTDKEVEADNSEDADIINVASPQRDRVDEKFARSVLPDDTDSLMCRESEEPSFTQSEALTCAEDSSLILFTEESECFSEPDDISSLQESLSVVPGSQTLADLTGTFDEAPLETSQEDSVFESSHPLTSGSPKQVPPEEDMAADSHTGTKVEGSTESQKDSPKPAAPTRSRFQRPRPNVSMRTLARKENVLLPEKDEITKEGNKVTAGNSLSQSQQEDISGTENPNSEELELLVSERKDDIPCPVQKNSSSESSQLQPGDSEILSPEFATAKKEKSKENPLPVRGRLVRPKPNLKKAPAKDKPPASEPKSPPKSDSQDPGEIATVPCSVVLTPLCTSVNEEAETESSTSSQEKDTSTIKPTPLVHECLQIQKPNTVRTSGKEKSKDMEDSEQCDDVSAEVSTQDFSSNVASCIQNDTAVNHEEKVKSTNEDTHLDVDNVQSSCIPMKETFSKPCIAVQEVIPEPDPAEIPVSESKPENKKSSIKLARGPLQRPKPNLLKSCDRKGISEMREENVDVTSENTEENLKGKIKDLPYLGKPTDFVKEVSTSDESCSHQENRLNLAQMDQVLPGDLTPKDGINLSEEVQKPAKPAVLTRGRLQRPKPNLCRALPKRGVLSSSDDSRNESKVEASDKPPESSHSAASLSPIETGKAHVCAKTAAADMPFTEEITQSDVPCKKTIGQPGVDQVESEESLSMSVDDSAIKKTLSSSEDQKSAATTKPTLTRNRLQRPKPNLGRSVICPTASAPQKCDVLEEGKNREDDNNTSSLENVLQYDAENAPVLANTHTEEITQSYILPLETVFLTGVDQVDSEKPPSVSVDNSSHVTIKKDLITSKDEKMVEPSPALTRSRLQRPKPNLGRSVTRPSVSTPEKCNDEERKSTSIDTSSIEKGSISSDKQNMDLSPKSCPAEGHDIQLCTEETQDGSVEESAQLDESSSTIEQGEGPSVKPLRNRLQKPKPNLGRASVRKESRAFASEQKEVNVVSSSKIPEHLESKGGPDLAIRKDVAGGNREESAHTTIKPAQLKRGRPMRPVPSLGMPPNKRPNVLQSKTVNEEAADKNLEVMSSKRKAPECFPHISSKISCSPDVSQSSSDSASDQVLSTSALHDSSQSNDMQEDVLKQHSRFGRPLKRSVSTTPPVLTKPSENVSERPEKEKTSRSVKSVKSKVTKPTSSKGKGKTTLVKIRAMKQDEDEEDDADLEFEDEDYDMAPDKLNQAPVFVPFRLRSPKPVPAEIEETVEELEIPVEDFGVPDSTAQSLTSNPTLQDVSQHIPVAPADPDNKGLCDGSTEAAMTLISIGNSVFQSKLGEPLDSDHSTESQLPPNTDCEPEASTLTVQMVGAAKDDTPLKSRPVEICHDTLGLQEGNGALSVSTDEQSNDLVISDLHRSTQSSHLLNGNVSPPLENMSYASMQQDAQQQDCSASDRLLEDCASGEETTFILTLVEIPLSEGYPYSCDGTSADVLPAPVLITSSSPQMLTPDQSPGNAASSEPSSSESCQSGQGEAKLMQNTPSRKRLVSVSSEENDPQPSKKAFLCTSPEYGEDCRPNTAAFEENEKSSSMPAEIKTKETEASHQSSIDIASSSTGEEKVQECTSPIEKSANASCNSPSRLLSSSSSRPLQQRPGKKPLGFLSLVCKEKQLKKTKVTSKKKILKPKCEKVNVQEPEEENSTGIPEDAASSEVPAHSLSSADTSTPTNTETIPSTCQDSENLDSKDFSENLDTVTQESPKSQDLATEEEAATVSEYFFSDIFMAVDE